MKDLYKCLGVPRQADAAAIAGRVATLAPGYPARVAAEQILLQPSRRVQYDLAFDALAKIGQSASRRPPATGTGRGYLEYALYSLAVIALMLVFRQVVRADSAAAPDTGGWGEFELR